MYNSCMHKPQYSLVATVVLGVIFLAGLMGEPKFLVAGQTPQKSKPALQDFFDDFNYSDAGKMAQHGWIIRTADGWPGIPGAKWPKKNVSLLADGERRGNRILRMTSSTDGTPANTAQTQICHQRKNLEV